MIKKVESNQNVFVIYTFGTYRHLSGLNSSIIVR